MAQKIRLKSIEVAEGNCTHLDIELYYSKGGMNYFSGSNERRGLYLSVSPVTKSQSSCSYIGFSGVKELVKEMARFNQKTLDTFEVDNEIKQKLINYVINKNNIKLVELEGC